MHWILLQIATSSDKCYTSLQRTCTADQFEWNDRALLKEDKKINVLFENVQFQSDTNFAHPSQPKELIWRSEKKFERKLKWNV